VLSGTRPPWAARYGAAAIAVALAVALRALLDPFLQEGSTFLLLSAAVLAAAAYGGLGPGVLATLVGAVAGDYLFLPPLGTLVPPSAAHGMTTGLFAAQGLAISALGAWLASSRRRAEESALRATEDRRSLGESEERYRAVVEQAAEGIYLLDATTRRVLATNPALQRMLGYPAEELEGMELYDLLDLPREEVDAILGRTLELGYRPVWERRYLRKDGTVVDVEIGASVIRYGEGRLVCAVLRDVTERKRAEEAAFEVREAERSRLARDLHDGVLQDLSVVVQQLEARRLASEIEASDAGLGLEIGALRRAVRGLREAIYDLRPSDEAPFPQMVEEMVRRYRELTPEREISLVVEEGFPSGFPRDASIQLLRLVREALTNARRHSAARRAWVTLGASEDQLEVEVADDGRGFVAGAEVGGMGLSTMRERAALLGGDLEIRSEPGGGTSVRLRLARPDDAP